jgi:tetratricopeptide (TPR) repeat protein
MSRSPPRRGNQRRRSQADQSQRAAAPPVGAPRARGPVLWISLALIAVTVVVYTAVRRHGFVNLDDPRYVTENAVVAAGLTWRGALWAFTTGYASNWHPLTWLSHMLDVQLYGMQAGGHHLTSLLLHIANTLLLFGVLYRMTGAVGRSAFVAALFAVHPLHVESVAWVAERKDVLSTLFWMLTLWTYVSYVRQPQWNRYVLVIVCFALGLLAKPMLVTLPCVLLLLDYWPLGRMTPDHARGRNSAGVMPRSPRLTIPWHLLREKLPLVALALASSVITFVVQQQGGSVAGLEDIPLVNRAENALTSYVAYIWKMLWPARLGAFYPFPIALASWQVISAAAILIGASAVAIRERRRHPFLVVGWFWYLGTLVPVIGLVQVGGQAMADRYTYIPLVGLFVIVAWGVPALLERRSMGHRPAEGFQWIALVTVAGFVIAALTLAARAQVQHWRHSIAIWEHTLQVTDENSVARNSLGGYLIVVGRAGEALPHLLEAVRIDPNSAGAHNNLGAALIQQGKVSESVPHFAKAASLSPEYADAHHNLGVALDRQGHLDAAIQELGKAVRLTPQQAMWHYQLGEMLARQGKVDEAMVHYLEALRLQPRHAQAHVGVGNVLSRQGRTDEAIAHYLQALQSRPLLEEAHNNLGVALMRKGKNSEAIARFAEAVRLRPEYADAHHNLAIALVQRGQLTDAIREMSEALRFSPEQAAWHYQLADLYQKNGETEQAIHQLERALTLNPDDQAARRALNELKVRGAR